jgi:isopentenyl diphosphate isomerase/L-lactate dehydrogenase-like FMN-dependent dehydrogenase
VVEAGAGTADVYLDGDMRCSTDVFQVLTLGARAGLMGRSVFWDLAVAEEAGRRMMLETLHDALDATMGRCSRTTVPAWTV